MRRAARIALLLALGVVLVPVIQSDTAFAQQLVVEEGPLTPECPFGICPVTNRPRTAQDFYILFGYLPKSAGHFPGIPTSPPPNWPKRYYTPRPGSVAAKKTPQRASAPASATSVNASARKPNPQKPNPAKPAATAQAKPAPKVVPAANRGTSRLAQLTAEDARRMRAELQARNGKLLDALAARLERAPAEVTPAQLDEARRALGTARTQLAAGELRNADLVNLTAALNGVLPADGLALAGQVAANQQVFDWLQNARVGANPIPAGRNVPIALIPGLQAGMFIPLGFGPTLVGMGRGIDQIVLGQGNVWQAAGLPAPEGPPVPDFEGPPVAGDVLVLTNVGEDVVNYAVDGTNFSMQPTYTQTLDGTRTWTVAFDRGGNLGTAEYQIGAGWYEFTPTERGWELFRQSFDVTITNSNDFDFQYVSNGETRTLTAGESETFTGKLPPLIQFADAEGQIKNKRLTGDRYDLAVTTAGAVEIYPDSSMLPPPEPASSPVAAPGNGTAAASGVSLPPGFAPLDPVAILTAGPSSKVTTATIPPAFTMFATEAAGAPGR